VEASGTVVAVDAVRWRDLLHDVASAVVDRVGPLDGRALLAAGERRGQYHLDLMADRVVLDHLARGAARAMT
jgi:hypothetical protein